MAVHRPFFLAMGIALLLGVADLPVHADEEAHPEADRTAEIERQRQEMALLAAIPEAVDRGAAWLAAQQISSGGFVPTKQGRVYSIALGRHPYGETALAALTLVHCGAGARDPLVERATAYLRRNWRRVMSRNQTAEGATYSLSLTLMLLHALYERADPGEEGVEVTESNPLAMPRYARGMVKTITAWLLKTRSTEGLFWYPMTSGRRSRSASVGFPTWDLSNTQFALLGLWAASRCGERVDTEILTSIARTLLAAQAEDGEAVRRQPDPGGASATRYGPPSDRARGFSYTVPARLRVVPVSGSMTAGGLSSLLIVKAMLQEADALEGALQEDLDQGIWDAIAWLSSNFTVAFNPYQVDLSILPPEVREQLGDVAVRPTGTMWHYYYLYGLERACVIAGKRYLGDHDWYLEGARLLVDAQHDDGRWVSGRQAQFAPPGGAATAPPAIVDTCFALLFLRRASLRPRAPLLREREAADDR
ncbi:MAG: prenyltransferase/squalene oxidase repeat-containing protein [Planctomycetota bacterium]